MQDRSQGPGIKTTIKTTNDAPRRSNLHRFAKSSAVTAITTKTQEPGVSISDTAKMGGTRVMAEVKFLNPMGSMGDIDKQNRQVRSLTMRRIRKQHRWASRTKKTPAATAKRKKSASPEAEVEPRSGSPAQFVFVSSEYEGTIPVEIASSTLDPFWTIPLPQNSRSTTLLSHYLTVMSPPNARHGETRVAWFQFGRTDPAFLNALLCTAAMHRYATKVGSYIDVVEQTTAVVRDINNNLAKPMVATSCGNIAAISWLYFITISPLQPPPGSKFQPWDVEQQPLVHLRGLQRMLDMVGGLQGIATHRLLYTCLLWFQTHQSMRQRFVSGLYANGIHAQLAVQEVTDWSLISSRGTYGIHLIVEDVRGLSMDVDAWEHEEKVAFDGMDLLQRCCFIVMTLMQMWEEIENEKDPSIHDEVLILGSLIFTGFLTDLLNFNGQIIQVRGRYPTGIYRSEPLYEIAKLLRKSLDRAELCEPLAYETQLWAIVLGAVVSWGTTDRMWFESRLLSLIVERNLQTCEDMMAVLLENVWLASDFSWYASELWQAVMGT